MEHPFLWYIGLFRNCVILVQVPLDYIKLAESVRSEADRRTKMKIWPVLNDQEFWDLVRSVPNNSINNQEELNLGEYFSINNQEELSLGEYFSINNQEELSLGE